MKDFCEETNKRGFCAKPPLNFRFRRISIRKTVDLRNSKQKSKRLLSFEEREEGTVAEKGVFGRRADRAE